MTSKKPTRTLIARIKREAKATRDDQRTHSEALEAGARAAGYESWHALLAAAQSLDGLDEFPIDPVLPANFNNTPNDARTAAELDRWWDRPFAVTLPDGSFEVRCLDGGAWDRSTWYGHAATVEEAKELGQRKLAKWRKFRSAPRALLDDDAFYVIRSGDRPGDEPVVLKRCKTAEEAGAFINQLRADDERADASTPK